jgi:hypothetical protein
VALIDNKEFYGGCILKNVQGVFVVGLVVGLISLSGCHGSDGNFKARWVNETDSGKVLEVTLQYPSALARMHMAVFGGRVKGTYLLKDGDKATEGRVTQMEDSYRLTSPEGKEQKFSVERDTGSLKDESGASWKADNPPQATVKLKEW